MKNIITNWLITNSKSVVDNDLCLSLRNSRFSVYSEESKLQKSIIKGEKISILIDGFILPRFRYNNQFSNSNLFNF